MLQLNDEYMKVRTVPSLAHSNRLELAEMRSGEANVELNCGGFCAKRISKRRAGLRSTSSRMVFRARTRM